MARQLLTRAITRRDFLALSLAATLLLPLAPAGNGQTAPAPIRVESNEVLVPVYVMDKRRWDKLKHTSPAVRARDVAAGNLHPWQDVPIAGLTATDFQLLEDGREQKIQSATLEDSFISRVHDSAGKHYEYRGAGGGRWIYPDLPNKGGPYIVIPWPFYLISYPRPESAPGSCHQVMLKVQNRRDVTLIGLTNYCNIKLSAADPLQGTRFGQRMDALFATAQTGNLNLSVAATVLYGKTNQSRIHLAVEFPPAALSYKVRDALYETIGMMARVYAKDGTVLARFSDFDCCQSHRGMGPGAWVIQSTRDRTNMINAPVAYQREISLPAGEYSLAMLFSDGANFGRVDLPLTIERRDPQHLSVSDIAIAKRCQDTRAGSDQGSARLRETYVPWVSQATEYTPTASPRFQREPPLGKPFFFYFEIYAPPLAAPTIQAHLRIIDAETGNVRRDLEPVDARAYVKSGSPIIPIGGGLYIGDLPSGAYRLEVQATDSTGQTTPWRSASFAIE